MKKSFATTLDVGTSLENHTGSWRTMKPEYVDCLPPCNQQCPAGEDIQGWLFHASSGDYQKAWLQLTKDNPFPAIMGRVCYHTCEIACNRAKLDTAVKIHCVERFLGDEALKKRWQFERPKQETKKHILIVGAGPAGMSAAYHLRLLGHSVTVYEERPSTGGMMRYGIPTYRLPRDVLDAEMQRIIDMGVTVKTNTKADNVLDLLKKGTFDAVFLAIGAHVGKRTKIASSDAAPILDAVSFLRSMEEKEKPKIGRRVVVYGGGNTAIDAACTARRLGAEAIIVYRRTRDRMPAHPFEIEEALQEGVTIHFLSTIKSFDKGKMQIEKMRLNASGFPEPTGETEEIKADSLILALGQDVDISLVNHIPNIEITDGVVKINDQMMTGHPGLFAGGDMVPAERNVTVAIGHGKKAARCIDAWLRKAEYKPAPKHDIAAFEKINPWYYPKTPESAESTLDLAKRKTSFEEVHKGLDGGAALLEAQRCMSCGNCFECNNCYGVCPDNAIIKLGSGKRFKFNYDYCKGCGICPKECPCGAIKMVPEEK